MKPKRKHPEYDLQVQVADYLRAVLDPSVTFTAIGHGGGGKIRGAKLKRAGLLPGVPDILLFWRRYGNMHIMWFELKAKKGVISEDQRQFAMRANDAGHEWTIVRSVQEAETMLIFHEVPTRGRVMA